MGTMVVMTEHRGVAGGRLEESPWDAAKGAFSAWRQGDAAAVDELVRVMTPVLWHVVRSYGHDRQTSEDIVQTTWLGFVRSHQTIVEPGAVAAWLITSARRDAARHLGHARRSQPVEGEALATWLPDVDSAEALAVLDDEGSRLWKAVSGLDERCRRLVSVIAFLDRPDYASLGRELDMPVGSIGPTRARCLDKLRAALAKEGRP
ncbi:sigma-70 family RNA polymerase sigma factor [Nocardioides seonyuensis]|uniref:Sigma-70 family RNA polymerase sigma factor n=2 Tax=Nocardioides seonyuensis TaxID=2518371 RepID=A0A4P7IAY0_9ACTN|nr:sigma-70 family RNA polymerase sigma factor [Nocardioides seonyuensis]